LFGAEEIDKKVKVLSGGEKSRLAIAKLLLDPYNLLVLDEPTNHLDMSSKEILKNALNNYDGTLIIVSHDRDFLQGLTNKTYEFIDGKVKEHLGTIDEFLDKKKHENFRSFELDNQKKQAEQKAKKEKQEKPSEQKVDYQAKKELEKEIRQLKKDVNNTEKKVEEKEGELAELEEKMLNPDLMNDPEKSKQLAFQHGNIQKELDQFLSRWEKQLESLSALEDQLSNQFAV
jgi:ATP-binding cassette subfamily F protein 3